MSPFSRKGLYPLHDGPVRLLGFTPELQISEQPEVQRVPGPHQHREQSFPVSQLGGAKEALPTDTKTIQTPNTPPTLALLFLTLLPLSSKPGNVSTYTFKLKCSKSCWTASCFLWVSPWMQTAGLSLTPVEPYRICFVHLQALTGHHWGKHLNVRTLFLQLLPVSVLFFQLHNTVMTVKNRLLLQYML